MSAPIRRLSVAYFAYFSALGLFTPFWSPYLALRGFDAVQIGVLLALGAAVRAIGPLVFGWIADSTGRPTLILRSSAALAVLAFAMLPLISGFAGFAVLTVLFGFAWHSIVPSLDAHTMSSLGSGSARYGRIRLWGSLGFIALSWLGGAVFQAAGYGYVPPLMFGLVVATLFAVLTIPVAPLRGHAPSALGFRDAVKSRAVWVVALVAALVAMSFGPYYAFFSLYLEGFGYSRSMIGFLWALGVIAEIAIFALGGSLWSRYSIRALLAAAAGATAIRWLAIAWLPQNVYVLAAVQLLHCMGFAVLHFALVLTAQRQFPSNAVARGQALFSSVGYGLGGMLGSLFGGIVWSSIAPRAAYLGAAIVVVCATLCAVVGLRGTPLASATRDDVSTPA